MAETLKMGEEERKQGWSTEKPITAPSQVVIEAVVVAVANVRKSKYSHHPS